MKWLKLSKQQAGATLIEVLVAIALLGLMLPALIAAVITANVARPTTTQQVQAASLLHEDTEAVLSVREAGWSNVAVDGTYHTVISGSGWSLASGTATSGQFTESVVISDVQRDSSGNIVSSGGSVDPSTKLASVTVSWSAPIASSLSSTSYLSRWQNESSWTQTTQADFNAGTFSNTSSTGTGGGIVQITAAGHGVSWATPALAGSLDISGTTNANDIYVDSSNNRAYVVNGTGLSVIDVSNPASPSLLSTFNAGIQINGVYVVGNYAYLASTDNNNELTIVDVSNPAAPVQASSLNLGNNANANCIFVTGGYAYVGKALNTATNGDEFYVVNVNNPTAPTLAGSLNLNGSVDSIYVNGNDAYLATSDTTAELEVIDISNKSNPTIAGTFATTGAVAANAVYYDGYYVYLGEANNAGGPEFFVLKADNPAAISQVGSFEFGGAINGIKVVGSEAFLATSRGTHQFSVLNLSPISAPTLEGNITTSTADAVYVANNTAYLASTSDTAELTVMQPSAKAGGNPTSGAYESPTFDTGSNGAGLNYLSFTDTQPTNTSVSFQIAANNDNATWNYLGPDGTPFTSYTSAGTIPLVDAADRYFRYKATLNTTNFGTSKPNISDVTLDYSP